MKKFAVPLLIVAIISIIGYFLLSRLWILGYITGFNVGPAMQKPGINVYDIRVKSIGLGGIDLEILLKVYNPNNVPITFDRADFDIYINDVKVGQGILPNKVTIPAKSERILTGNVFISSSGGLQGAGEFIASSFSGKSIILRLEGYAYVDVPILGSISIPFSYSERIK